MGVYLRAMGRCCSYMSLVVMARVGVGHEVSESIMALIWVMVKRLAKCMR